MQTNCGQMWALLKAGGKRPFLITIEKTYSYADLADAVQRWTGHFDAAGVEAGGRFIIRSSDDFALASAFIAGLLDRRVPVTLASDTPLARLRALAESVDAQSVIHDGAVPLEGLPPQTAQLCLGGEAAKPQRTGLLGRIAGRADMAIAALARPETMRQPCLPDDGEGLAYLLFTSGTTSAPTGVAITRGNLFANLGTITRLFGYDADARIFNDMVLAHADGMIQGPVLALANGGAVVRAGGFALPRLEQWLGHVRASRATHFIAVPTIWAMIDAYAAHDDYFDAPELVSLQSVAAKLPEELWARIESRFGHPLASHYGLTETVASALYAGSHPQMGPRATLGLPVDCEARIDPAAADGGSAGGELQLRGANIFTGYWRNDARSAQSFTADGWFKTGDIAARNDDGSFSILGRLKNIIMSGGFLIRPDEIDEAMLRCPDVRECVTVALVDATFGEIAATAVVLSGAADEEALFEHARRNLEAQKVPRRMIAVQRIPRGISGKADLKAVIDLFTESPAPEAAPGVSADESASQSASDLPSRIIALAADVFSVKEGALSLTSGPGSVAGWDSFSQLNLVLEAEARFGIMIAAASIARIETLADLHNAVREKLA